jgi:8-hydroxy-5-deazaflavin:NADPH oxidoreductase
MAPTKKVGILGSGDVAKQLGRGFATHGYNTMLGTRDPSKLESWRKETKGEVSVGTFAQAADHGDPVIVAVLGGGAESSLELAGPQRFSGKLVLDATNPLDFSHGMPPGLLLGTTDSMGERVQRKLPDAHVVKCFNTVGNVRMIDPKFREGPVPMLICGNDAPAKKRTTEILKELGWPGTVDIGGIDGARWLEALVPLWVRAGAALNTWEHAFKVVQ